MTSLFRANLILTFRSLVRLPGFWVPTILFPAMLYAFFGAHNAGEGGQAVYAAASFAVYAVLGVAFFQFGVSIAEDRQSAFAVWQRSLPGGPAPLWAARLCAALVFSTAAVLLVLSAWQQALGLSPIEAFPPQREEEDAVMVAGQYATHAIPEGDGGPALGVGGKPQAGVTGEHVHGVVHFFVARHDLDQAGDVF